MNSRKRILDSAFYLEKHEKSEGAQADAAALRELDQLLIDAKKYIETHAESDDCFIWQPLLGRFIQAGYGEK